MKSAVGILRSEDHEFKDSPTHTVGTGHTQKTWSTTQCSQTHDHNVSKQRRHWWNPQHPSQFFLLGITEPNPRYVLRVHTKFKSYPRLWVRGLEQTAADSPQPSPHFRLILHLYPATTLVSILWATASLYESSYRRETAVVPAHKPVWVRTWAYTGRLMILSHSASPWKTPFRREIFMAPLRI